VTPDLSWLPPLLSHQEAGSVDDLYVHFHRDFVAAPPLLLGMPFRMKRHPMRDGREATFWHLISTGDDEATRQLDHQRCRRICWPRALVDAVGTTRVLWWRTSRGTDQRIVIALPDFSYVVIISERQGYVLLWTAYYVHQPHRRRKLKREYEAATK
jgi:hypothetical protein